MPMPIEVRSVTGHEGAGSETLMTSPSSRQATRPGERTSYETEPQTSRASDSAYRLDIQPPTPSVARMRMTARGITQLCLGIGPASFMFGGYQLYALAKRCRKADMASRLTGSNGR